MKRPAWLDPCISFCGDTPDSTKQSPPVLLDIHQRTSQKVWQWSVEIDFIGRPCANSGAWAQIDSIANCCGAEPLKGAHPRGPAMRGNWFQFNFKTAKGAFRFAQQTLLFVRAMQQEGIGLLPQPANDPLSDLYFIAQKQFLEAERETKWQSRLRAR
jgi:hypothetical protein